jgi:hypothetical protein
MRLTRANPPSTLPIRDPTGLEELEELDVG